jgi:PIN domain nuclease of toxin-antitoxin system
VKLLLDTQVALWWLTGDRRLPKPTRAALETEECIVSAASVWEVAIKHRLGKLPIPPRSFRDSMTDAGARILPVTDEHAVHESTLDVVHSDPFDRLLLAVAVAEQLTLLTADARLLALNKLGLIKGV